MLSSLKRIAIFFHYDESGQISSFIEKYIEGLKEVCSRIIIVHNGSITSDDRCRLKKCCDTLYVRDNVGYDSWAYKYALEAVGWEELSNYDELVLCNFTCYGPADSFSTIFDEMKSRSCDFWGIAKHPEYDHYFIPEKKEGYINEHIMSYFMVFRKNVITSKAFTDYWENLRPISSYREAVGYHEVVFTKYLEDHGFESDAFIDLSVYREASLNSSVIQADDHLIKNNCPLIKRKIFFHDYNDLINQSDVRQASRILNHLRENLQFDEGLIWDDLLRTKSVTTLMKSLHLRHILNDDLAMGHMSTVGQLDKMACIVYLDCEQTADYVLSHLVRLKVATNYIFLFPNVDLLALLSPEVDQQFSEFSLLRETLVLDGGDSLSSSESFLAILGNVKDKYEYLCYLSVPMLDRSLGYLKSQMCSIEAMLESVFPGKIQVARILSLFNESPRLGLLLPQPPSHGDFDPRGTRLSDELRIILQSSILDHQLGDVPLDFDGYTIPANSFWIRLKSNTIKSLMTISLSDSIPKPQDRNVIIHNLLPLVVQKNGFYSAFVITSSICSVHIDNLIYRYTKALSSLQAKVPQAPVFSFRFARRHPLRQIERIINQLFDQSKSSDKKQ